MGHRRNRRRCRRRSDAYTRSQNARSKPYESLDNPAAINRWNRINPSTALSTHRDPIQPTPNWQHSFEAWQLHTLIHPQHQHQHQHQQIQNKQPLHQLHENQGELRYRHNQRYQHQHQHQHQNQQRPNNDVISRYFANQQLERARLSAIEAQRIRIFGGEVGDEVSLCAPMLQVVFDLWGGVDYLDP